jgi:FMN phosphatase YigB (HAD superfamily)
VNKIIGIKAISFDADGTLWDFEKVMRHSLFHVLVELKKLDPETVDILNVNKMIKIRNRVANPRLFQIALEKAGCSRHQLLHVGDSLQEDIIGAINADIRCVWLNRKQVKNILTSK